MNRKSPVAEVATAWLERLNNPKTAANRQEK